MSNLVKLAEESIGAYLVGRKIAEVGKEQTQDLVLKKSSRMISSALTLILFGLGAFLLTILLFLLIGFLASQAMGHVIYLFITPITLLILTLGFMWIFRHKLFHSLVTRFLMDAIA